MSYLTSLHLKPISINFHYEEDCPPRSAFTARIEHGETVYRSGIFRSKRKMVLELIPLSWIQFTITKKEKHSYVHISLKHEVHLTENQLESQNQKVFLKNPNQIKEFTTLLPVSELIQTPANKKKRFSFPIMYRGQIKAEAQFKLVIRNKIKMVDDLIFHDITLNQDGSHNKDKRRGETVKNSNKKGILKPMMSDICIAITPQLFVKKQTVSLPQIPIDFDQNGHEHEQGYNQQMADSTTSNHSFPQLEQQIDLATKFEKLNRKFAEQNEKQNICHEAQSIWEQQETSVETLRTWDSRRKAQSLDIYEFDIIREENESSGSEN